MEFVSYELSKKLKEKAFEIVGIEVKKHKTRKAK